MTTNNLEELMKNFSIDEVKNDEKKCTIIGKANDQAAIIVINANSIEESDLKSILTELHKKEEIVQNDVFSTYTLHSLGKYFVRVIYPADEEKIKKYTVQKRVYIKETEDEYKEKLNKEMLKSGHKTNWIRNIINAESKEKINEKIYYSDDDIMIITNYKWNMKSVENLYLLVLFKNEDLYTIRELTDASFLLNIRQVVYGVVKKEFGLDENQVYCYFHYPPTYYALHLHVVNFNFYGNFCLVGKSFLLDDVIENLKDNPYYYKNRNIYCFDRVNE